MTPTGWGLYPTWTSQQDHRVMGVQVSTSGEEIMGCPTGLIRGEPKLREYRRRLLLEPMHQSQAEQDDVDKQTF